MNRLARDGTAIPFSRDQILRREQEQENVHFPCSASHKQIWQPYPVDPYSTICHTYTHSSLLKIHIKAEWRSGNKAYDSVHQTLLWTVLARFGVLQNMILVIRQSHNGMRACVQLDDRVCSGRFAMKQGLR